MSHLEITNLINQGDHPSIVKLCEKQTSKKPKVILVSAISPTQSGEGKTMCTIGLTDLLNKYNYNTIGCLREPSLGPVFGVKGGAVGGGASSVNINPSFNPNLHFTGDFHAITTANNLICAYIQNHIYHGNELNIEKVTWKYAIDINDRFLRDSFILTPASELMAIFCLSENLTDLELRINNIIIGFDYNKQPVYFKQLNLTANILKLLIPAFFPNLTTSLNNSPLLIHGGPFANIAHGCCSIQSLQHAQGLADYIVTEAGFGSDMGAEKYINIVGNIDKTLLPSVIVLVTTVKGLLHSGNNNLNEGLKLNLQKHLNALSLFNVPILVCINKFKSDTMSQINTIVEYCNNTQISCIETSFFTNEDIFLEKSILIELHNCLNQNKQAVPLYSKQDTLNFKLNQYFNYIHPHNIDLPLDLVTKYNNLECYISVIKDQKYFTGNKDDSFICSDITYYAGAQLLLIKAGNPILLPGLPKHPVLI